jgi:hypothetical protein
MTKNPNVRQLLLIAGLIAICIPPLLARSDVYSNTGRWFYESWMLSSGQIPYRDFTWQYPPLGLLVPGLFLTVLGNSTVSLYAFTFLTALGTAVAVYKICRLHGLESKISLVWTAAFFGASNLGVSKMIGAVGVFTPTWPIGLGGILIMILGTSNLLTGQRNTGRFLIIAGVAISLLSKPEFALATLALFSLMIIFRLVGKRVENGSDLRHEALILVVIGSVIAFSLYGIIALITGSGNLLAGVDGYGQSATRLDNLIEHFTSIYLSMAKEAARAFAGTTAIIVVLLLSLINIRSKPSRPRWLVALYLSTLVVSISLAGELIARNHTVEAVAIYLFALVLLTSEFVGWSALRNRAYFRSTSFVLTILLIGSTTLYELLASTETAHEILIMSPLRISPWIPVVATLLLVVHYLRVRQIERNVENYRLWLVFTLSTLAAGMQLRFFFGFGAAPEYSLAVLASLMLLHHFVVDSFSDQIGQFTLPKEYSQIPVILVIGTLAPTIVFLGIGKPVLQYEQHRQTPVSTPSGPLLVRRNHAPVINAVVNAVKNSTPEGSTVISTSYIPWVNYVTERPGLLPITQLRLLSFSDQQIRESINTLEKSPPSLIIEDLINDNGTEIGDWSTVSRSKNPWLWNYISSNYEYCAIFIESEPRAGLWGARFYVQRDPVGTAPDCATFKSENDLLP